MADAGATPDARPPLDAAELKKAARARNQAKQKANKRFRLRGRTYSRTKARQMAMSVLARPFFVDNGEKPVFQPNPVSFFLSGIANEAYNKTHTKGISPSFEELATVITGAVERFNNWVLEHGVKTSHSGVLDQDKHSAVVRLYMALRTLYSNAVKSQSRESSAEHQTHFDVFLSQIKILEALNVKDLHYTTVIEFE